MPLIKPTPSHRSAVRTYIFVLAFAALAAGLSDNVYSNYFKDAYNVTALQRGLIEFPRELPGVIGIIVVSLLSGLTSSRVAILAEILFMAGLVALGFMTPPFAVMLIFLFISSLGSHLWMPQQDNLGMKLIREESDAGKTVGKFKGVSTAFSMVASMIVFIGFRLGLFSFTTPIKYIFLVAAGFCLLALILLARLDKMLFPGHQPKSGASTAEPVKKFQLVVRREYKYYYLLAIVFGVQKQIMMVYGPWVLIDLLSKKADTIALLSIVGAFLGIFFIPAVGRWIDRFGIKKMLYADAFSFIGVYMAYGLLSAGFADNILPKVGLPVILAFALFIFDRLSMQMGMVRSLYLRSIAVKPSDIGPTLTLGQSMDHVVSILCATLGGLIWGAWGPQYIFFMAAAFSLVNYFVASKIKVSQT